ncbi:MAG: DNA-binding response regulator [Acidobacteria bacterium]|nr:MAG: DNA-binding response regulator [Acidobacteriota bacterium]PYQ84846.1 MAG: DNA-binding response regulator [Acidobacteriota bacterium]PYR13233.1 MAG: DNA-binding response regulator [Acidobacteriota bacterium]PYR95267.1 MAG: DNA-binding response regulator [Acidobacteriota bacterium]
MIRTLIVDDSPLIREGIRLLLESEKDIEVVGEAADGALAVSAVSRLRPDLIFLDVQMPGTDGFEVLEKAVSPTCAVIFVTAYDDYALRAFQANAVGYLLKPITPRLFQAALQRARQVLSAGRSESTRETSPSRSLARLVAKDGGRFIVLRPDEVDWISSAGDYVELHAHERSFLVRHTLSELESALDPEKFVRIHRTTIVNADRVRAIEALPQGDFSVMLTTGARLRLSRSYRARLLP